MNSIPFFCMTGARSTVMSSRSRQPTAIQGFEGTKWYFGSFVTTVTLSSGRNWSFSS